MHPGQFTSSSFSEAGIVVKPVAENGRGATDGAPDTVDGFALHFGFWA